MNYRIGIYYVTCLRNWMGGDGDGDEAILEKMVSLENER